MYKNKEWLEQKYIEERLSTTQIAKLSKACCTTIIYWMKKHNIVRRTIGESNHYICGNHCNLSSEAIEWINGELLGDGCIYSRSKYSARFAYSSQYLEYVEYVRDTLKSFGIEQAGKINGRKHKKFKTITYSYSSLAYPELLTIYKKWYPEGKKIIPRNIVLTPLTCRQWYIGDGSLARNTYRYLGKSKPTNPGIKLSTNGFTILDVEYLLDKLIEIGLKATRKLENSLYITTSSVNNFLEYIGKCPVECYKYKWNV